METTTGPPILLLNTSMPNTQSVNYKLLKKGVCPTPKTIHILRKKELQRLNRRIAKHSRRLTDNEEHGISEEIHFQVIKSEFRSFNIAINTRNKRSKNDGNVLGLMVGKPWERLERQQLRELANRSGEYSGENLEIEHFLELSNIIEKEWAEFGWLFENDTDLEEHCLHNDKARRFANKRSEADAICFLVHRLSGTELTLKDYKFSKLMKQSGLLFTEAQLMKIIEGLGDRGKWNHALSIVQWVYSTKEHKYFKSRFVYTKLLAVLGKLRRPREALNIFNFMQGDFQLYPDMAAYRNVSVTLGQAGLLRELMNIIGIMKKPPNKIKNMSHKKWDPVLFPDVVVLNAVLNACIPTQQWRGVSWVFEQLRRNGLKPNGATLALAMEVMMQSGKYDLVHEIFKKMKKSGEAPKALTYKVLVKTFREQGKVKEAAQAVRDMEQRGVIGTASVYYELACCLCYNGKWKEAIVEIEKLTRIPHNKPLEVTFTGMILSAMHGGHFDDCEAIFHHSKSHCAPNIGMINAMLNIYDQRDMFSKAIELFENIKGANVRDGSSSTCPDACTYSVMLEVSSKAVQWEYFEYVYQEMVLYGYQLNQTKHACLLVKASKAGKWHLLEHAFNTILEAGDIPDTLLFTELFFQAISQCDYKKAFSIAHSMAYAPIQFSEQQWKDLFLENANRISTVSLGELLNIIEDKHDLAVEASISSLSAALQSLCLSHGSKAWSDKITYRNASCELHLGNHSRVHVNDGEDIFNDPAKLVNFVSCQNLEVNSSHLVDMFSADYSYDNGEVEDGLQYGKLDQTYVHNLPPACEILDSWKKSRKYCTFTPFQFNPQASHSSLDTFKRQAGGL